MSDGRGAAAAMRPGTVLGQILELRRYPVKSMQGEPVEALEFDDVGAVADRRWAVRDETTGRLLQARTTRPLIHATARLVDGDPVIALPDGTELFGPGSRTDDALSAWLGRPVRLVASQGGAAIGDPSIEIPADAQFAAWTDEARRSLGLRGALARMRPQPVEPVAPASTTGSAGSDGAIVAPAPSHVLVLPSLPGSFNDCEPVSLLSESELAAGRHAVPDADWDRRRFRPNIILRDRAGDASELAWVGWRLAIGEVVINVTEPTLRCAMTTVDQPGLEKDPRVLGALAKTRGAYFGRYGRVVRKGTIRRGDPIRFAGVGAANDLELFEFYRARIG